MNQKNEFFYKPETTILPSPQFKDIPQLHDYWMIDTFPNTQSIRIKVRDIESKGARILSLESTPCWESRKWQVIIHYEVESEVLF